MLALSLFSFVGLSGIQSFAFLFDGSRYEISLNIEEESETKTQEETEVKGEKEVVNYSLAIEEENHLIEIAYQNHLFSLSNPIMEVATPPPKA